MRLALFAGDRERIQELMDEQKKTLKRELQSMFLNTLDVCSAFLYAILGCKNEIPEWIASGRLDSSAGTPSCHAHTFYGPTGRFCWQRAIIHGSSPWRPTFAGVFPYPNLLCTLYLEIQLSGAFYQLGDNEKALSHLQAAFTIGEEDRIAVPFAENAPGSGRFSASFSFRPASLSLRRFSDWPIS